LALVERALKIDPKHVKALALAGTAAFNRGDFAAAVRLWERLAEAAPPDAGFRDQVQGMIAEARQRGGLAPAAPVAAPKPMASASAPAGAGVRGTVRLASALAAKAAPEDTLFIVARASEGPRMPLAILRKQVKDLPVEFALDDAMAMTPETRLSLFPKIVIEARIAKSGLAQPGPGDLTGRSSPVANGTRNVAVEINQVVPN
jgi:cytochrome c-type biogenesis protein CcmH